MLTIAGLEAMLVQGQDVLASVKSTKAALDVITNSRQVAFKDLRTFATQVVNAFAASGVSKLTITDARSITRKMQGRRAKAIVQSEAPTDETTGTAAEKAADKHISVSQLGYNSQLDHFQKLVQAVSLQPAYTPNEAYLSVAGLEAHAEHLQRLNFGVIDAYSQWSNARILRDKTIADPVNSMAQIGLDAKQYVKSIFGGQSAEYKQISALRFIKKP